MNADCGECNEFLDDVLRHFSDYLTREGFEFVACVSAYDGRECGVVYESSRCRLLFTLHDGARDCALGALTTPLPADVSFYLDGEAGWYSVLFLIGYRTGKRLLTRRQVERIWRGEIDKFAWVAGLLDEWSAPLTQMFDPAQALSWRGDFLQYMDAI